MGINPPDRFAFEPFELGLQLPHFGPLSRVPLGVGAGHVPGLGQQRLQVAGQAFAWRAWWGSPG